MRWEQVTAGNVQPLEDGDIAGSIQILRTASLRELRNEAFLREELLLNLGLNGERLEEFPQALYPWCGKGIRSWQYPIQFAPYLTYLSDKDIKSYLEIGCRFGGTFIIVVEYLRRFSDLYAAVAIDIEQTEIMTNYVRQTVGAEYRIANSTEPSVVAYLGSAAWDFAFIDGDHSYEGCSSDFQAVRQRSKRIGLHDISSAACPGVVQTWREIRRVVPSSRLFEATNQYDDVRARTNATFLGIGVVDFT